jgi:trimethylamine--corrinoid protein Co-methyltransferase
MPTTQRRQRTLGRRPTVDLLSASEVALLHESTLEVLERTGVHVRSERVLDLLAESDAQVDREHQVVRFPRAMVAAALAAAPSSFLLASRDPAFDLQLDRSRGYYGVEGGLPEVVDLETGEPRSPVTADLVAATRLADALDEISYLWPCTSLSDVPPADQAAHQTAIQLANSSKHVIAMTTYSPRDARTVIEMGEAIAGGNAALRARPVVSSFACSISPLTWDGAPLESALTFAAAGVPCGIVSMPVSTAGAPTTIAGHVVIANAEILSGITILETLYPGAPTYYTAYSADMDMITGAMDGAWGPEPMLYNLATAQLARGYGLPVNIGTNGTGSKRADWQAGAQHALMLMGMLACGNVDLVGVTGGLDSSRVFSFEQVLLDCELWDVAARLLEGFPVDAEHLALDVIDAVGPGNHFLAHRHTRTHMREHWRGRFFGRETWDEWEAAGRPEPPDRARDRARELIASHEPLPLAEDVNQELQAILARATRQGVPA